MICISAGFQFPFSDASLTLKSRAFPAVCSLYKARACRATTVSCGKNELCTLCTLSFENDCAPWGGEKGVFLIFLEDSRVLYDLQGNSRILKVNVEDLWKAWAFLWTPYCIQQLTRFGGTYLLYFFRLQTVQFCNYIQTPHHGYPLNTDTSLMITDSLLCPWGKPLHFL